MTTPSLLTVEDRGSYLVVSDPKDYRLIPAILDVTTDRDYTQARTVLDSLSQLGNELDFIDKRFIKVH